MKCLLHALLLLAIPLATQAANIQFIGPCNQTPFLKTKTDTTNHKNLGELTIATLKTHNIPFKGVPRAINSINNSPIGLDALEVLSDTKMRAYGWCNLVNGVVVETMADETPVYNDDEITWYYCYTVYDRGEWLGGYEPSYELQSDFICKKD